MRARSCSSSDAGMKSLASTPSGLVNIFNLMKTTDIRGDIRDIDSIPLDGVDAIIHLANIANDPELSLIQL